MNGFVSLSVIRLSPGRQISPLRFSRYLHHLLVWSFLSPQ